MNLFPTMDQYCRTLCVDAGDSHRGDRSHMMVLQSQTRKSITEFTEMDPDEEMRSVCFSQPRTRIWPRIAKERTTKRGWPPVEVVAVAVVRPYRHCHPNYQDRPSGPRELREYSLNPLYQLPPLTLSALQLQALLPKIQGNGIPRSRGKIWLHRTVMRVMLMETTLKSSFVVGELPCPLYSASARLDLIAIYCENIGRDHQAR